MNIEFTFVFTHLTWIQRGYCRRPVFAVLFFSAFSFSLSSLMASTVPNITLAVIRFEAGGVKIDVDVDISELWARDFEPDSSVLVLFPPNAFEYGIKLLLTSRPQLRHWLGILKTEIFKNLKVMRTATKSSLKFSKETCTNELCNRNYHWRREYLNIVLLERSWLIIYKL